MPLNLYGGAFDPFHNGHAFIVHYVLNRYPNDSLMLLPSNWTIGKSKPLLSNHQRLRMLRAVFNDNHRVIVSDLELKDPRPSKTIHTVLTLLDQPGIGSVRLIIGSDQWIRLHEWANVETLLTKVSLLVIPRATNPMAHLNNCQSTLKQLTTVEFGDQCPPPVSSSIIRQKRSNNESIKTLVPDTVFNCLE